MEWTDENGEVFEKMCAAHRESHYAVFRDWTKYWDGPFFKFEDAKKLRDQREAEYGEANRFRVVKITFMEVE